MKENSLIKPLISEKSYIGSRNAKYFFVVPISSNRSEIKKAIASVFKVHPIKINTLISPKRVGRYGRIKTVKRAGFKKAIVTLKAGETIDLFPKA